MRLNPKLKSKSGHFCCSPNGKYFECTIRMFLVLFAILLVFYIIHCLCIPCICYSRHKQPCNNLILYVISLNDTLQHTTAIYEYMAFSAKV